MIRELIDTELETVAGGLLDVTSFAHSFDTVIASNSAPQFSQAFGGTGVFAMVARLPLLTLLGLSRS